LNPLLLPDLTFPLGKQNLHTAFDRQNSLLSNNFLVQTRKARLFKSKISNPQIIKNPPDQARRSGAHLPQNLRTAIACSSCACPTNCQTKHAISEICRQLHVLVGFESRFYCFFIGVFMQQN
jgi:hypothetical protein